MGQGRDRTCKRDRYRKGKDIEEGKQASTRGRTGIRVEDISAKIGLLIVRRRVAPS